MKARIITGVIVGSAALAAIILGGYFFGGLIIAAAGIGVFEFVRALKNGGKNPAISPAVMIFLALPAYLFSKVKGPFNLVFTDSGKNLFPAVLCLALIVAAAVFVFDHKKRTLEDSTSPVFGAVYIVGMLWCGMALRELPEGMHLIIMTLIGSVMSDTCAFAIGSLLGKKKLCPDISPKKTVEGMWGGFVGGALGLVIYGLVLFLLHIDTGIPFWFCPILGALVSFVSQAGDLFMSAVKRQCGIKDFGKILPGHGGVLDRIDSYLPSFAVTYFIVTLIFG
ncbi:MAG: phosphatidate cytidylyltransferase [Clostridia bacterium]|nr:phosphatidate cytidylyltransferase [Clostridia bacterium]